MKNLNAIITGGAGFIGSHLTEMLLNVGYKVTVIDNFSSGKLENIKPSLNNPSLTIIREDLKNPERLSRAINNCG